MPEKKRQHYVPKFYLKRFSESSGYINLLNVDSNKVVLNAKLKTQAYKDYFYGSDLTFEKTLEDLETKIANQIDLIVNEMEPPKQYSDEHLSILYYTILQRSRTLYASEALDELTNKSFQEIMKKDSRVSEEMLKNVHYGFENPAQYMMRIASDSFPLTTDLKMKILVNRTTENFITSDNPVAFYNKLFEYRDFVNNTGLQSKGLFIFFPLDPKVSILFFDSTTYKVGDRNKQNVFINSVAEIRVLNRIQIANCNKTIYFLKETQSSSLIRESQLSRKYRRKERSQVNVHKLEKNENIDLIVMYQVELKINLELSFLRIQKRTKKWLKIFKNKSPQPVFVPRDIYLTRKYVEYRELSKKQIKHPLGFAGFLMQSNYSKKQIR